MTDATTRIGFLGAGKMATALARAWLSAGLVNREDVAASDPEAAARISFEKETRVAATDDNKSVATRSNVLVLAVKPQNMAGLLAELLPLTSARHLVISIAAGITLARLAAELKQCRLVRVMPNTPCLVSASASAFSPGPTATPNDIELVNRLLKAVGLAYQLPEKLLDAVTGLSGSGPAYIFVLIEALSDGGVRMGLPRDVAVALAAQTVLGSAKL